MLMRLQCSLFEPQYGLLTIVLFVHSQRPCWRTADVPSAPSAISESLSGYRC